MNPESLEQTPARNTFSRRKAAIAASLCGVALTAVVSLAPSAVSASSPDPVETWKPVLGLIATSQGQLDHLPSYLVSGEQAFESVDFSTTHALGSTNGTKLWAALSPDGRLCVIVDMNDSVQLAGLSCSTPEEFATAGLGIQVADRSKAVQAYLLPDGYVNSSHPELIPVGTNVVVADPYAGQANKLTLSPGQNSAPASAPITLLAFPAPEAF
ncbi:hypothetical protein [Subtercola frigoramans]|uniref:Uncharacterized protein n=1 Tax=Subtercola frigoramans TaxID=120298 RepID=A0ABS2L7P5_9MICO|nr:hypothetical protein [Subtercola frigoramans]MBM7473126.1 hypothetical protein [Subtercola frigoramans]